MLPGRPRGRLVSTARSGWYGRTQPRNSRRQSMRGQRSETARREVLSARRFAWDVPRCAVPPRPARTPRHGSRRRDHRPCSQPCHAIAPNARGAQCARSSAVKGCASSAADSC
eukprot:scaffold33275_cov76-Phaeocystis_antarctica.AAC.5